MGTKFALLILLQLFILLAYNFCQASKTCPRGCDCNDQQLIVYCNKSAALDYVPHTLNPALKSLYLSHSGNIRGVKSSFEVYKNLVFLDLSGNNIQVLGEKNFISNSKLETIILNNNNISDININTFTGLVALKKIDLSSNIIESLDGTPFQHLKSLEFLDLSFNKIKNLSKEVFDILSLKNLNISNNFILNFHANLFQKLPNLVSLNASNNRIETIYHDQFKYLTKLTELDFSNCSFAQIDEKAFRGLISLRLLYLQQNKLESIPTAALAETLNLQVLNIGYNGFQSLQSEAFAKLKNLRLLYISNNSFLENVHFNAFYGLENLKLLELSNNEKLSHIGRNVFDSLFSLSSLILSNNNFTTLEIDLITRYKKADLYLDVRGNPFNCNCSLEWLNFHFIRMFNKTISTNPEFFFGKNYSYALYNMDALLNNNFSDMIIQENAMEVKCTTPFALENKLVIKLHKDKFGCFVIESFIPIIIGGIIGLIIIIGVVVLSVIRCKYQLSGFVKNQFYAENARNQMDLYHKPEFVFVPSVDYNTLYKGNNKLEDLAARYPLRMNCPTTEL